MTYIVAILLIHFDKYKTFKYFTNLLICNEFLYYNYTFKIKRIDAYSRAFERILKNKNPLIAKFMKK